MDLTKDQKSAIEAIASVNDVEAFMLGFVTDEGEVDGYLGVWDDETDELMREEVYQIVSHFVAATQE